MKRSLIIIFLMALSVGTSMAEGNDRTKYPLVVTVEIKSCPNLDRKVSKTLKNIVLRTDAFNEVKLFSDKGFAFSETNPLQDRFGITTGYDENVGGEENEGKPVIAVSLSSCQYYGDDPAKCSNNSFYKLSVETLNEMMPGDAIELSAECLAEGEVPEKYKNIYHSHKISVSVDSSQQ